MLRKMVVAGLLLACAGSLGLAQNSTKTAEVSKTAAVPKGSYQPFDVWQKVRFGATALVNPRAAESASVVYSYEPAQVARNLSDADREKIRVLLATGQLQYGKQISRVQTVVDPEQFEEAASRLLNCKQNCEQAGAKLLSLEKEVAGVRPSGTWIAWEPTSEKDNEPASK